MWVEPGKHVCVHARPLAANIGLVATRSAGPVQPPLSTHHMCVDDVILIVWYIIT